jgi:hypothetical protein
LVEYQIEAGKILIAQLVRDDVRIEAAFWMKEAEGGIWSLYIASSVVDEKGPAEAYRVLQRSHQRLEGIPFSLSEIKLIGERDPITMDVLDILARFHAPVAARLGARQLGGVPIEGAYVYPSSLFMPQVSVHMTQHQVFGELFSLLSRGPGPTPTITLKDGTAFKGVPFSIQSNGPRPLTVQFVEEGTLVPRVLGVDQIASIQ